MPTLSYGLEKERFGDVAYGIAAENATLHKVLIEAGLDRVFVDRMVHLANNKAIVGSASNLPFAIFYTPEGEVAQIAQAINFHEFVRIDVLNGQVSVGDREGIQAEYEMATLLYDGNVDTMLAYTTLEDELRMRIKRALEHDLPLDAAFAAGIVRLVYSVKRDDQGVVIGYGEVEAVRYKLEGEAKTAIRFDDDQLEVAGFFRPDGLPAQRTWLATPVPGAPVSSPYNLRRQHPVLQFVKPHYGTDYAAPYGTPILAVSDGIIIARSTTRGNGKFIKIKHDDVYQTQYLHMKAFARGIKPGSEVRKGQVIGYVGSTGLSSGPHVCFRFWKNGQQVDHRAENLNFADELTDEAMSVFEEKGAAIQQVFERA